LYLRTTLSYILSTGNRV